MTAQPSRIPPSIDPPCLKTWTAAILVGQLVAVGEVVALAPLAPGVTASALLGSIAGVTVGAAQWPCLRRVVGDVRVQEWILTSALGGAIIGGLVAAVASQGPYDASSLSLTGLAVLVFGAVAGAIFGGLQGWVLRRWPRIGLHWAVANTVGWSLGLLLVLGGTLGMVLSPSSGTSGASVAIMGASIAAMALVVATATGCVLAHATSPESRRRCKSCTPAHAVLSGPSPWGSL